MQSQGSLRTPSLQKMNAPYGASMRRRGAPTFSIGHLIGDPFALATVSIAVLGWIIILVAAVISTIKDGLNKFIWWVIAYEFVSIVGVALVLISDTKEIYQVAVVGFLAVGAGFATLSINSLVYTSTGEQEATAVGFILLSIVIFVWIFYFGSTNQADHRRYLDSLAFKDQRTSTRQSRPMSTNNFDRPQTTASGHQPQNLYTSAQLNGFETSSPVSGYPGGAIGAQDRNASQPRFQGTSPARSPTTAQPPGGETQLGDAAAPAEYPYRAKAIYSYEANPDDANEISFTKHEVLEVSDVSGRWWQAKKENGETGIAPSNYLILL